METKERILNTAVRLFIERGFYEVSLNDIIKEVDIAKGGFYHHFKSKDELIYEAMEKYLFPYIDNIIKRIDEYEGTSKEKLKNIFNVYSELEDYLSENFEVKKISNKTFIILIVEVMQKYDIMAKRLIELTDYMIDKVKGIIEKGQKTGEISTSMDIKATALSCVSLIHGVIALWVISPEIDNKMVLKLNFDYMWNSIKNN